MSKLADLIRRAIRTEPGPIGFATAARKAPPTLTLVAIASDHYAQGTRDGVAAGADAVLLSGRPGEKDVKDTVAAAGDHPCGVALGDNGAVVLREAGADFIVIEPETHASALLDEQLGFVYHLRGELSDTQLRTLDPLPLDAILVDREAVPVTIARQMELQRISALARTALLVPVPPEVQQDDLLAYRDSGVAIVAVDLKERNAIDAIKRLRAMIDELPKRRIRRREERASISLPGGGGRGIEEHDHDDDEDD
jgi:hypothetical protein